MESVFKDVRYGCRTLRRNPGFTAVAVISLALGIGANTAIFSFINTVLLKDLPVREPAKLVLFGEGKRRGNSNGAPESGGVELFSWKEYQDFQKGPVFSDLLAVDSSSNWSYPKFPGTAADGDGEALLTTLVSGNYFETLGAKAALGRLFDSSADAVVGGSPLAVISYNFWERRFRQDPGVAGMVFRMGKRDYTIIGVAAPGFFGARVGEAPDMWIPATMQPEFVTANAIQLSDPQSHFLNLIGRLRPGMTKEQAAANINVAYQQILSRYLGNLPDAAAELRRAKKAVVPLTNAGKGLSKLRTRYEEPLIILMVVVGLVLAIACANVANLLIALAAKRQREIAVRLAIGAGRRRLFRQLLTEGVMLSGVAGILGILLASAGGRILVHLISTGPRALPLGFELDGRVIAFTLAVSVLTGVLFSLAPAVRAGNADLISSLKEGKANTPAPGRISFGRLMVGGQVALSLTLLMTAGLLVRSFANLIGTGTGFDRENVLLFKIDSAATGHKQDAGLADLYRRVEDGLSHLPGVVNSSISLLSFAEGHWNEGFKAADANLREGEVGLNMVSSGFFATLHIPLVAGRVFDSRDTANSLPVAVVSETFAKQVFGDSNPLGRTFAMAPVTPNDQQFLIVGVVRDAKMNGVRDKPEKLAYLPLSQAPVFAGTIAVRVNGDSGNAAAAVRGALHAIEPNLPIRWTTTLADEVGDSLIRERAVAQLATFFAALALLLSAIGLYGAISFAVSLRTNEIGIRMALGAERAGVLGMVLRDAAGVVIAGVAVGIPLSIGAGKAMHSLLYGLSAFDAMTFVAAIGALTAAAGIAGYLPARRAASVDPLSALRHE